MGDAPVTMPDGRPFEFWDDETACTQVYHVARAHPKAADTNPGTEDAPWATIGRAAKALEPGEKVVVHAGVYRECVRPARGGTGPDRMIAYEAAAGEEVVVRASEVLAGPFEPSEGWKLGDAREGVTVWMADLPRDAFGGYNPFAVPNLSSEYTTFTKDWSCEETERQLLRRGMVFVGGLPLAQVYRSESLGTRDGTFWVEEPGLRIHFRLSGDADPGSGTIEVSVREQCFAPSERGAGFIRVQGLVFEHAANGLPVPQRGMVSAGRGHHWIIEGCTIRHANALGLDLGKESWHAPKPSEEARWTRHVVRGNRVSDCGACGIAAVDTNAGTLVEDNIVERIGGLDVERVWETAGLKFHRCDHVLIRRNVFRHIRGAPGVWLDFLNRNSRVTENVFADVEGILGGCYVEVSHAPNRIDHNVFWDIRGTDVPADRAYAGPACNVDSGELCQVDHNFFGRVRDHYAVAVHLTQKARVVGGRVGLGVRHTVTRNVFVETPRRVFLSRRDENTCDANLYDARDDRMSLAIEYPEPRADLTLAAWQEYFGLDTSSTQAGLEASFDPETLELVLKIDGDLPEGGAGPWDLEPGRHAYRLFS